MKLHETNAQGFLEGNQVGNQVGNEDGHHVLDKRVQTNKVLRDRVTARRRDGEMDRRSRSNKVPTSKANQAGGPCIEN